MLLCSRPELLAIEEGTQPRMGMGRGRAQLANGEHPKPRSRLAGDRDKKTETTRGLGDRFHCAHVAPCLHATCPSSLRDTCSAGTSLKSVDGAISPVSVDGDM